MVETREQIKKIYVTKWCLVKIEEETTFCLPTGGRGKTPDIASASFVIGGRFPRASYSASMLTAVVVGCSRYKQSYSLYWLTLWPHIKPRSNLPWLDFSISRQNFDILRRYFLFHGLSYIVHHFNAFRWIICYVLQSSRSFGKIGARHPACATVPLFVHVGCTYSPIGRKLQRSQFPRFLTRCGSSSSENYHKCVTWWHDCNSKLVIYNGESSPPPRRGGLLSPSSESPLVFYKRTLVDLRIA